MPRTANIALALPGVAIFIAFMAAVAAALLIGTTTFISRCADSASPWSIVALLASGTGVVLYGLVFRSRNALLVELALALCLAPMVTEAVVHALSSGEWLVDLGPALASFLVLLWIGNWGVLSRHCDRLDLQPSAKATQ